MGILHKYHTTQEAIMSSAYIDIQKRQVAIVSLHGEVDVVMNIKVVQEVVNFSGQWGKITNVSSAY